MTTTPTAPPMQPSTPKRPRWSGTRTALVVLAGVIALLGATALAGGGVVVWLDQQRDGAGYLSAGPGHVATDKHALSAPSLDISAIGPDVLYQNDLFGKVRIQAKATNLDRPLFLGIGPADQVAAYLKNVDHDEISDIEVGPFHVTYTAHPGSESAADPTTQGFWAASETGTGPLTVDWQAVSGNGAIVIMNADTTPGVRAGLSVGATLPVVTTIATVSLVTGGLLLLTAIAILVATIATRRPRQNNRSG